MQCKFFYNDFKKEKNASPNIKREYIFVRQRLQVETGVQKSNRTTWMTLLNEKTYAQSPKMVQF